MDISGLTNTSASNGFTGYGGTASLPAITQAQVMVQSQSLSLLPPVSGPGLGNLVDIYDAVGKQALGALSGLSSVELTRLSMGIGDGQTAPAPQAAGASSGTPAPAPTAATLRAYSASDYPGYFYPTDGPSLTDPSATTSPGFDAGTAAAAPADPSAPASAQTATATDASGQTAGAPSTTQNAAIGSTLDQLLKEDGYVAPEENPYVVNKDYFSDTGSLGGLLDSLG